MAQINKIVKFLEARDFNSIMKLMMTAILLIAVFTFGALDLLSLSTIFTLDLFVLLIFISVKWPNLGLYAVAFFFPFWGWEYVSGNINVPYVDLVAMSLFAALIVRTLIVWLGRLEGERIKNFVYLKQFPGWKYFILFFIASGLALWHNADLLLGLKYLLRPILFFYLMFVVAPTNVIVNKKVLEKTIKVLVVSSLITVVIGILSLILSGSGFFLRSMQPITIWGFNPLGGNHNAVAEVLLVGFPMALYLYFTARKIKSRGWYVLLILAIIAILLLTFSRSGWLALLLQLLLLYFAYYGSLINRQTGLLMFMVVVLVLLAAYFVVWDKIQDLEGANSSRWLMTSVAWYHFLQHPFLGNGLNSFNELVGGTYVYQVEFGDPLDSHGFLQKLMTESGLLGLISFLSLLGFFFVQYLKHYFRTDNQHKIVALCFVLMLVGVVFFQLFSTSYFLVKMWLPISVGLVGIKLYS